MAHTRWQNYTRRQYVCQCVKQKRRRGGFQYAKLSIMKTLLTLRDSDFGIDAPFPEEHKNREAARAIVYDHGGNIALISATKEGYHKLPGGGVDAGENIMTALARELKEEIGCEVTNVRELGAIEEYRGAYGLHHLSYCFLADLVGEKGEPHLEEDEIARGFETVWTDLASAVATLTREAKEVTEYSGRFMVTRDLTFLKAAQQEVQK